MEAILDQAKEQEREFDWVGVVKSLKEALGVAPKQDFPGKGEIYERLGYAFYKAAMQAENRKQFRDRLLHAVTNYEQAKKFYSSRNKTKKNARILRCHAMIAYIGYWLSPEASEKKRLIDECWNFAKESLRNLKDKNDVWEFGRTYNQLSSSIVFKFCLAQDFQARENITRDVIEHGEQAINFLSMCGDSRELSTALARTAFYLGVFDYYFLDINEKGRDYQKAQEYWTKAKEFSEDVALFELLYPIFGGQILLWGEASDETMANLKKALEYGKRTKDKFIIGCVFDWLAYHTAWSLAKIEDIDEKLKAARTILQYSDEAKCQYLPISFISPRADKAWVEAIEAEYYVTLFFSETNASKRRNLLEKARPVAQEGLARAETSGYPEALLHSSHIMGAILTYLANLETDSEKKRSLLEEALEHRNRSIRIAEQHEPLLYWNRGIMQSMLARIKCELAQLARNPQEKKSILQEAISDMENGLRLCFAEVPLLTKSSNVYYYLLGNGQYTTGVWFNNLYELTNNREYLKEAAEAFNKATESYQKINLESRMAECDWKVAQTYNNLEKYLRAAESFDQASDHFRNAAEKIPQLRDFYQDHAVYTQAWSEIEKARYHHAKQEYGSAREHFERATILHKSLKQWSYLAPNYSAWAKVESAEESSREEQCEESIKTFRQAVTLFGETRKSLQAQLIRIESFDEKQMATNMVNATALRREYCLARIAVEEARILDKKGDHYSSSEKYGSAVETFEKISRTQETEQEQREINFIIAVSRAWQKMTLAEAESSPTLYLDASQLFEQAKDFGPNEKTKMLVLGHSRFCRALEAGTKFSDTRDPAMHAVAIQYLASAANYYTKADFQTASEYAKATKLLFDAYLHMDNAEKESDPEKRAKLYAMAEKVLQMSAGSYTKAEHPEKMEQVMRLLEKAKEERELAVSLIEVLHAPPIISTTTTFATPTPNREEAVGLERFEHADIQANLISRQKQVRVGENLDFEIELVNAGKGSALLTKIMEVVPEGFELTGRPENCRVEDSYLNMKGKRLDPLKTEEIRIIAKPMSKGTFTIKPRILYLDEDGKCKSYEPEPISITVRELGIKGWLRGEK